MATVGKLSMVMVTLSLDDAQGLLTIVQLNVTDAPATNPVTPDVAEPGVVIVAEPDTMLQLPVPTVGAFPVSV